MSNPVVVVVGTLIALGLIYLLFSIFGRKAIEAEETDRKQLSEQRKQKKQAAPAAPSSPAWIVMLLKRPRLIDEDRCRRAAGRAWQQDADELVRSVETIVPESQFSVMVQGSEFKVQKQDRPFMLPAGDASYKLVPQPLPSHKGWLSVGLPATVPHAQAYPLLGKYVVELSARDPSHVLLPGTEILLPYDGDAKAALQDTDPLAALRRLMRMGTMTDEQKRSEGAEEARTRWPEFVAAFVQRKQGQKFTVLATVPEGGKREDVWVEVNSVREDFIHGKVDVAPVIITRPRLGEPVRVKAADVHDWVILEGTRRTGGFTTVKPKPTEAEARKKAAADLYDDVNQDSGRITLD